MLVAFSALVWADGEIAAITADSLLEDVRMRLPQTRLKIEGELHVRRPRGVVVEDLFFSMDLNWGARPATARYVIRDAQGAHLESLTLTRDAGNPLLTHYVSGESGVAQELDDLTVTIQSTDVNWLDLTLAFLWWRGGSLAGREDVRGRPAFIIDIPAPATELPCAYASVRLWIDEQARMLLQAQGFDAEGTLVKMLWVKSFKKIDDQWMIKDLEVQRYPVVHRTKVRVNTVEEVAEFIGHEFDPDH